MTTVDILKSKIETNGPISLAEYMETCLYHEEHGYYMSSIPLGKDGDFTTAPEITQIFGEMIGAWVADTWMKMGKPENWQLLEAGPGKGTLMKDMLRTLKYALPECYNACDITLLEVSPMLKIVQREALMDHSICWASNLDEVDFSLPTIVIANELLDAFPVRQFKQKEEGQYTERLITVKNDKFTWVDATETTELNLKGDVVETTDAMNSFLCQLKDKLNNGAALFIDYGDHGTGDTIQALKAHEKVSIFAHPGTSDLTTQVNFDNVRGIFGSERTSELEPMAQFLTSIGMPMRAAALMENANEEQKQDIEQAMYRLMHPEQMGEMFKVMAYRTHREYDLAGLYFAQKKQESHAA